MKPTTQDLCDKLAAELDAEDLLELVKTLERKCDQLENDREFNAAIVRELKPLAEIGRLAVEHRRMGVTAVGAGAWYDKLTEINTACDTYTANQSKP